AGAQVLLPSGHQAVAVGVDDRLDAVAQVEFGEDARHVRLDRLLAEHQRGGDLAVRQAVGDEAEHFQFARGERGVVRSVAGGADAGRVSADELPRHLGGQQGGAGGDGADAVQELRRRGVLEQESAGPGPQRLVHVLVEVERRHHEHLDGVGHSGAGEFAGGFDAVEHRHPHVHDHHVRFEPPGEVDGGAAVAALADHFEVGLGVDDGGESGTDERLVVADQDANGSGHDGFPAGMLARTTKASARWSAANSPPRAWTRSRRPARPRPLPPGEPAGEPGPSVLTSTVISFWPWRTRTTVRAPWAYLRAFVRDSWTTL